MSIATAACVLRAVYGAALLVAPGAALGRLGDGDGRARAVARLLGARQLAEAALTRRGRPGRLALGAAVDAAHCASMAGLAVADPRRRRPALANAAVAAAFATEGVLAARAAR